MVIEMVSNVARRRGPKRSRRPPARRVRIARGDIIRDIRPLEMPDADPCVIPQVRKDTACDVVETFAVGGSVRV